ncbi:MAG: site-2 protease family protein [Chloroflexota bacterium]|nr:site-2 protease family protein [Chloroflexota bacterium]
MLTQGSLRIGRIRGIEIGLHPSLLIAFLLIAWTLAGQWLPQLLPGRQGGTYWLLGICGALGLFASVLIHELGHSFTAQARGIGVHNITLFIFGGVANIAGEPETPRDEFWITAFGPLTSFGLALLGGALWLVLRGVSAPLVALAFILAAINLQLAVFNLIPGFPLDGGRILRSLLWGATGDLLRATRIGTTVGQFVGYGFIILGIYRVLVSRDLAGGLWMAFIGWFLQNAAEATYRQLQSERQFAGVRVADAMTPDPVTVEPGVTIARLVDEVMLPRRVRGVPVLLGDRLLGIITITDIQQVPRERWSHTFVSEAMTGGDDLRTVHATDGLVEAMRLLGTGQFHQLPVLDGGGRLAGMLSRADIIWYLQHHPMMRGGTGRPASPSTTA